MTKLTMSLHRSVWSTKESSRAIGQILEEPKDSSLQDEIQRAISQLSGTVEGVIRFSSSYNFNRWTSSTLASQRTSAVYDCGLIRQLPRTRSVTYETIFLSATIRRHWWWWHLDDELQFFTFENDSSKEPKRQSVCHHNYRDTVSILRGLPKSSMNDSKQYDRFAFLTFA